MTSKRVENAVERAREESREAMRARGVSLPPEAEPTMNGKGWTYHVLGPPEQHWLSSLPDSSLPLLDAGACYGVHTIHALHSGRDVIAIDMCEGHINILRERVEREPTVGRLVRTVVAKLPDPDVITDSSMAGILCSDMIHFLKPGEPKRLFEHFFRWLAPGGKVVATAGAWPTLLPHHVEKGFTLPEGRSVTQVLEMVALPPDELVDAAPGLLFAPDEGPWKGTHGDFVCFMSTTELAQLAVSSGFEVEEAVYYDPGKYAIGDAKPEVLLVARKPVVV